MTTKPASAARIEAYIDAFPVDQPAILVETLRRVRSGAPESIRYDMPAFRLRNGHSVYFAGWKHHLSLHDIPVLAGDLEPAAGEYRNGKDTLRSPYKNPIPTTSSNASSSNSTPATTRERPPEPALNHNRSTYRQSSPPAAMARARGRPGCGSASRITPCSLVMVATPRT